MGNNRLVSKDRFADIASVVWEGVTITIFFIGMVAIIKMIAGGALKLLKRKRAQSR